MEKRLIKPKSSWKTDKLLKKGLDSKENRLITPKSAGVHGKEKLPQKGLGSLEHRLINPKRT